MLKTRQRGCWEYQLSSHHKPYMSPWMLWKESDRIWLVSSSLCYQTPGKIISFNDYRCLKSAVIGWDLPRWTGKWLHLIHDFWRINLWALKKKKKKKKWWIEFWCLKSVMFLTLIILICTIYSGDGPPPTCLFFFLNITFSLILWNFASCTPNHTHSPDLPCLPPTFVTFPQEKLKINKISNVIYVIHILIGAWSNS